MQPLPITRHHWNHALSPGGVERLSYRSACDGRPDWALAWRPPAQGRSWIVFLHGHGSFGDQLYGRADIRQLYLQRFRALGFGILTPNLRDNAWMCPEAVTDLHQMLKCIRREFEAETFCFFSGSMGGTGNLIYAVRHPEDVRAVVALCPATDIAAYHNWCARHPGGVRDAIRLAIEASYGGRPDQVPERYALHRVTHHAQRLTMPVMLCHATGDNLIPVAQSRQLHDRLAAATNVRYLEIAGGHHDSPLHESRMLDWLEQFADAP